MNQKDGHWHPIVSGVILGIVLFISFMVAGQGMGASGAFARITAQLSYLYNSEFAQNLYAAKYLFNGNALANWTVVEVFGIFLGGYLSAMFAGRIKQGIDRGDDYPAFKRLLMAFVGGFIMASATRLARGCTSGQALDGAAAFSAGTWIFMLATFGTGFLLAPLFKKQWKNIG